MNVREQPKGNSAFYHEVCILRLLANMGYLNEKDLIGIIKIAAEDYGSSVIFDKSLLCLNS